MDPKLQARLDALYRAPPKAFVAARDALARELKLAGEVDASKAVRSLRKPTPAAWAVNFLFFEHRADLDALLEAASAGRTAQERDGDGESVRAATRARADAARELVRIAERSLVDAGHAASAATLRAVENTLNALVVTTADMPVQLGRLERELEPMGFDVLSTAAKGQPTPSRREDPARPAVDPEQRRQAQTLLSRVRRATQVLRRELSVAVSLAERSEKEAQDAEARAAELRARADEMATVVAAKRTELDEAESQVAEAEDLLRNGDDG